MESRSSLHYAGNTVRVPHPGRKRLNKNLVGVRGEVIETKRKIEYKPKVCATYKCVWCKHHSDQPIIICPACHNCQYCGQYQGSGFDHECLRCGNHLV